MDDLFLREVGIREFEGLRIDKHNGYPSVEFKNWLFTSADKVPGAVHVPFTRNEDPSGEMEALIDSEMVRSEDNIVQYFSKLTAKGSNGYVVILTLNLTPIRVAPTSSKSNLLCSKLATW